jgi:tRNA pseudouridine38-40 synthase
MGSRTRRFISPFSSNAPIDWSDIIGNRKRYFARVSYDGTHYIGWQFSGNNRTSIQGMITKTLTQRFGNRFIIAPTGASRTDSGVHAKGQAVHFDIQHDKKETFDSFAQLEYQLNQLLPDDIRLYNLTFASPLTGNAEQTEDFHATRSARGKLYSYRFCLNPFIDPFLRKYCSRLIYAYPFDMELFQRSLEIFVGTHDFSAFSNQLDSKYEEIQFLTKEEKENYPFRTIYSISLLKEDISPIVLLPQLQQHYQKQLENKEEEKGGYYRIDFHIKSALHKMIRNIVGSCFKVANGSLSLDELQRMLREGVHRNDNKCKPAEAKGLTLEHVYYDHY